MAGRKGRPTLGAEQGTDAPIMVPFAAYHELVRELAAMKREGFQVSAPAGEPAPMPGLSPEIEVAILALGVDPQTERQLRKTAWELRRAEVPDSEIAQRITDGEPVQL